MLNIEIYCPCILIYILYGYVWKCNFSFNLCTIYIMEYYSIYYYLSSVEAKLILWALVNRAKQSKMLLGCIAIFLIFIKHGE